MIATDYPTFESHQAAWEELAQGIASIKGKVSETGPGGFAPGPKTGELIIIGSGIETIGVSLGDKKLIEEADKVLYCVADPVTIVWLKKMRPDALDLYVLYGENKVRYTTYMQMAEAQLYWVRMGFKVVVIFYGHPGVFVLSTHRAIKLARREGYKATMKASVCALDTLCADLGVDPCHPGLQTHEATDCLIRHRVLDTTLHVILWQVGLIGELGFRRQGYLNNNFSYFIKWLQGIYGEDYEITHYIGSRYPTIEPITDIYKLSELHDPEKQAKITGLSTFYIPPRDVVPTHLETVRELGIIKEGQHVITPKSPLREIGLYGPKEMQAFKAFANFRIPPSYKWQAETEASNFMIEMRFDTGLQDLYTKDPQKALADPRFAALTDRERALLASRDAGAVQIACKGGYVRSTATEQTLARILTHKTLAAQLLQKITGVPKPEARDAFNKWLACNNLTLDWAALHGSIDFMNSNNVYPWTGVYIEPVQEYVITILGNQVSRVNSIIYLNDKRITRFTFENSTIKWKASPEMPYSGFLRPDTDQEGNRRLIGKIWPANMPVPSGNNFVAAEPNTGRKTLMAISNKLQKSNNISDLYGGYIVRTTGRFIKDTNKFCLSGQGFTINGKAIFSFKFAQGKLSWTGGDKECFEGEITALTDPITNATELFGQCFSDEEKTVVKCYGSLVMFSQPAYCGPEMPEWACKYLAAIVYNSSKSGGLLLWHKWEKQNFTSMVVNKHISNLT